MGKKLLWLVLLIVVAALGYAFLRPGTPPPPPRPSGQQMKAVVYEEYGTADVLRVAKVDQLLPNENQVLVKVRAAAANPLDWHYMRGTPYFMRIESGLSKPKSPRLGVDMAGEVVAVGSQVTRFKEGDEVFGAARGAFGEYVLAADKNLVEKPPEITFEQAAAVPVAALTALQGLRDKGRLQSGQRVLINGASGGVGTFAVQIAKAFGAHVSGVCSTRNIELVRSLGADQVFDYTKEDFVESGDLFDVILDNVGNRDLSDLRRVMSSDGIAVLIGGGGPDAGNWIGPLARPVKALIYDPFVSQEFAGLLASINREDLAVIAGLMTSGKVRSVIDRSYTLDEVPEAIRYLETGRARGKVIVDVAGTLRNRD